MRDKRENSGVYWAYMKKYLIDRKRMVREQDHLTRPPRLEPKVKNAMMNPVRKKPKKR